MPVKRVFSAGGIVIKRMDGGVKVLLTQHSKHRGWEFPKGHKEIYETAQQTAIREVEEEAGVKGEITGNAGKTEYFYFEDGSKVLKTVEYFLMKYIGEGEATTAYEVSDMVWLPLDEVEDKLTFKDLKKLWGEVKEKVGKLDL